MPKPDDRPLSKALFRYQVISAYIALSPARGQRRAVLEKLAARTWTGPDGEPVQVSAETIRAWARRYRQGGLAALEDKPRPRRGIQALSPETIELACSLKREVPARSLDRIITILEGMGLVEQGLVRRSTLHRALRQHGLSARRARVPDAQDLDRFEADAPNDLWQSDMLAGPWLPDPQRPGKMRRSWLYAFLDDHSRLLLHGSFSFKGDLPALELVLRRALQKYGQPRRLYYDNGATYRSHHMRQIAAELGMHGITFTKVGRPMGHGKIEAFNRYANAAFIEEVKASRIRTLEELNEAFVAWADLEYNRKVHSETGAAPVERWATLGQVRWVDEEKLRLAFLWKEERKADKAGLFSLFGTRYQVGAAHAGRKVEIRFDPEHLDLVEVWRAGRFIERVKPFQVQPNRRPKQEPAPPALAPQAPVADWLGHLVKKRRLAFTPSEPAAAPQHEPVVALLAERLDPAVRDDDTVRAFLERHGPFEVEHVRRVLDRLLASGPADLHPSVYLDALLQGGGR